MVSTKSKIVLLMMATALAGAIVFGLLSFLEARHSLRDAAFDELTAIRTARAEQVETYFDSVFDEALVIVENPLVSEAATAFGAAYTALQTDPIARTPAAAQRLRAFYDRRVLPELSANISNGSASFDAFAPESSAGRYLQTLYMADNPHGRLDRQRLVDTDGTTAFERVHAAMHPELAHIHEVFGYYDLMLIDHETGAVVYSVRKEIDFASDTRSGPFRGSALAEVVRRAAADPAERAVHMSDLTLYLPSDRRPALFVASAIREAGETVGILVIQLTHEDLNAILTARGRWTEVGLKDSGETYLVGEDYRLRSESRFAVEAFDQYADQIAAAGTPVDTVADIRRARSSVLRQEVRTEATRAALAGETDTRVIDDYRGVPVLSSFAPVRVQDQRYAVVAEMDAAEAFAPVRDLLLRIVIAAAVFVPLVALLGVWLGGVLLAPARRMRDTAGRFLDGEENAGFDAERRDEWGQLGARLNHLLDIARTRLSSARDAEVSVETMTRQLMPRAIGERHLAGERDLVSAESDATVAVLLLSDDPRLNDLADPSGSRVLYEALDDRLDDVAGRESVDIVNQPGMHYTAFCGLTAPIKNNAERVHRFVRGAAAEIAAFNREHDTHITLRVGVETGPTFGALIGTTAMAYEVWGPSLQTALDLAHLAEPGEAVLSRGAADRVGLKGRTRKVQTLSGHTVEVRSEAALQDDNRA